MTKKNWFAIVTLLVILAFIAVATYSYIVPVKKEERREKVTVVVYGSSTDRWTAFRQGSEQAARDKGAVLSFIELSEENDSQEQQELISREEERGVEGIVLAVTDSQEMSEYVKRMSTLLPVVLTESNVENGEAVTCVSADAYEMGRALAELVLENSADVQINVLQKEQRRLSQKERLEGFMDACSEWGKVVNKISEINQGTLLKLQKRSQQQVLVAMDDLELEEAISVLEKSQKGLKIYGIGSSERIVYALDHSLIEGIIFQNEFNMGYEAVDILLQKIRRGGAEEPLEINFHQATRDTLHQVENERLLYPIIQ